MGWWAGFKLFIASLRKLSDLAKVSEELAALESRVAALEARPVETPLSCAVCGHTKVDLTHSEKTDGYYTYQISNFHCPKCGDKKRDTKVIG
jgi:rubrerythrin